MKRILIATFLSISICNASADDTWLEKAKNNIDENAVIWIKEQLRGMKPMKEVEKTLSKKKCSFGISSEATPAKLMVFISFSVPEAVWISLSKTIAKFDGVFILRGLPNNSFQELSRRLYSLRKRGALIPIQINPMLFEEFAITHVPAFVVKEENRFDKVTGNVSIPYAIELMGMKGDTKVAKQLLEQLPTT